MMVRTVSAAIASPERYNDVIRRVRALAQRHRVTVEVLDVLRHGGYALPFLQLHVGADRPKQMLISGGTHGDEPAGVYAALECAQRLADADCRLGAVVLPCTNPTGFVAATRRNDIGYDLNRTFGQHPAPHETQLVRRALAGRTFACTLDLHEDDDADGFYVYEHVAPVDLTLGPAIVRRVRAAGFPIHSSDTVEGYGMQDGCVVPKEEKTSELVGFLSVYLFDFHTAQSLTTETPTALSMQSRIAMHLEAFNAILTRDG